MNPATGGPCEGIRNSNLSLFGVGVSNEVVCCDSSEDIWIKNNPFPVHAVGPGRFGYAYAPDLYPWLLENIPRFDAVIVHGLWQWPVQATIQAFKKLKTNSPPATRHPRLFIMPHGMLDPWFQRDKTRRIKAIRNSIYWWLFERHAVNFADALLFTCDEELRLARTTFRGYHPKKEITIGYGIADPPVFELQMRGAFQSKCPELGNSPYLLFLGRIHPKKGVDLLIRAYAEVQKTDKLNSIPPHLVIAGPGWDTGYGKQMLELIDTANAEILSANCKQKTENLPRIHAVGMLEGDAKWGAFHGCEAFILPSHQENFGIAVVEALACGRPALISDKVNIWREIESSFAGFVVNDSFEEIVRILGQWCRVPKEGGSELRPLECFRRHFKIESFSRNLAIALKDI